QHDSDRCTATVTVGTADTVAFSPTRRLLAAGRGEAVTVWDWKNGQLLHRLPGHNFHQTPVSFSGDGRLATGSFREGLKVWDPETGILLCTVPAHHGPISAVAFSADGK